MHILTRSLSLFPQALKTHARIHTSTHTHTTSHYYTQTNSHIIKLHCFPLRLFVLSAGSDNNDRRICSHLPWTLLAPVGKSRLTRGTEEAEDRHFRDQLIILFFIQPYRKAVCGLIQAEQRISHYSLSGRVLPPPHATLTRLDHLQLTKK